MHAMDMERRTFMSFVTSIYPKYKLGAEYSSDITIRQLILDYMLVVSGGLRNDV